MASLTTFTDEALIAFDTLSERAAGLVSPSLRLGVTGLSRAGKTVFISAFVHNLIHGGRLPLFEAQKSGRIARAMLEAAAGRRGAALPVRGPHRSAGEGPRLAGFDARHLGASAHHRI